MPCYAKCYARLAHSDPRCERDWTTLRDLFNSYMELFPGADFFGGHKAEVAGFAVTRGPSPPAGREQADADSIGAMHRITLM